ncbi:MAG: inverse autotransporter beta domain-containing protein [Alphaproteobacteria bacterium]|nr:inverse autotransporter beta domain-containing protein [Alphaproteobacteria bacterium]
MGAFLVVPTLVMAEEPARKWGAFLDIEGKAGTKRNLGEAALFVPLLQDERTMLFGDVRFKMDDQNSHEGNFGLGVRRMMADGWNAGFYGFYDRRHSPNNNMFDQLTFGAEALGTHFDFRANSYWPVGNVAQPLGPPTSTQPVGSISGSTLQVTTPAMLQRIEYALRGFDAEAGVRIPIVPVESPYQLRFYAGGFRFDEPTGVASVVAGPRLRLELTDYDVPNLWNGTRFTVGAEWQTDEVRGSQFFAGLRLRVPLQAEPDRAKRTLQERRMTDTIVRDVDIVANAKTVQLAPAYTEQAVTTATGQAITGISSATTAGTALPGAVTAAGTNSVVVLSGGFVTTASTTLQTGQTLYGGGTLSVRTASGRVVDVALPSASISSTTPAIDGLLTMGNNSTVSGVTFNYTSSSNGTIIGAAGSAGATITGNRIVMENATGGSGISIVNGSNITIGNNSITMVGTGAGGSLGIFVQGVTGVTVSNNSAAVTSTATAIGLSSVDTTGLTVSGNSLSAVATSSRAISLRNTDVVAGSTGNVRVNGTCATAGANTGSVSFTDGTTCP